MEEGAILPFEFDTEVLGLKCELVGMLSEMGFGWFADFTDVECGLTDSSISLRLLCAYDAISPALDKFCSNYAFTPGWFDEYTGRVTLFRVKGGKSAPDEKQRR
jgi:hypothetical protein